MFSHSQGEKISAHVSRDYAQLRNCSNPIGNGVLFPDVTKAVRDVKAISDVTKKISKNGQRPKQKAPNRFKKRKASQKFYKHTKNKKQKA